MTQECPICRRGVTPSVRYPDYVCGECAARASAPDGRLLRFSQESMSGGYQAAYAATGEAYSSHECFIGGVRCRADEAYMGGIVVRIVDET